MKHKSLILFISLLLPLAIVNRTFAADETVSTAQTSTVAVTGTDDLAITDSGSITITTTGSTSTNSVAASLASGDFSNDGTITINSDTSSSSSNSYAVNATSSAADATYTNNGSIILNRSGPTTDGVTTAMNIENGDNPVTITNNGSIEATVSNDYYNAIDANSKTTIYNNGRMILNSQDTNIVYMIIADYDGGYGDSNLIVNNGTISVSGTINNGAIGIYGDGSSDQMINNGTIIIDSDVSNIIGIASNGQSTITNRGSIIVNRYNSNAIAVGFTGQSTTEIPTSINSTFNYYTNGLLGGRIYFGSGAGSSINVLNGMLDHEHVITYEGTATGNIGSGLLGLYNSSAKKIAIFNKTEHARANETSTELTNNIQNIVYSRLVSDENKDCQKRSKRRCRICACNPSGSSKLQSWVKFFGNHSKQPAYSRDNLISSKLSLGGVLAGYDTYSDEFEMNVGFYGGAGYSKQTFDDSKINVKNTNLLFGVYSSSEVDKDLFLSFILGGGYQYKDRERKVYNNLVTGGSEVMSSNAHSFFFSPSVNLSYIHRLDDQWNIIPSLSVNYINENTGEYEEKGGNASSRQIVESRFMGSINTRLQLDVRKKLSHSNDFMSIYGGFEHRSLLHGKDVTIKAIGQTGEFDVSGISQLSKAFIGAQYNRRLKGSINSFVSVEVSKGLKKSTFKNNFSGSINAGVSFNF